MLIEIIIAIMIFANIMGNNKYNGEYYRFESYVTGVNEIISSNLDFEIYLKNQKKESTNVEIYNQLRNRFNEDFFNSNSLAIVSIGGYYEIEKCELESVKLMGQTAKIDFEVCAENYAGNSKVYCIPINSKVIEQAVIGINERDVYDNLFDICKNVLVLLIVILIAYILMCSFSKKIENQLIRLVICIVLIIILLGIGLVGMIIYDNTNQTSLDKPVIYLYPEQEMEVEVNVLYPENLTCSYPEYRNSWKVLATSTGKLTDIETSSNEGFVVKGKDTISFLEEKLEILGLTEREANEFIIYWLPQLEDNKYNYIRFQNIEEINENMPLVITTTPDTVIRIMMEYKPLTEYMEVKEQILTTPER